LASAALAAASALATLAAATLAASFSALLSGFSRALWVILEVTAASRTAFARDLAAFIFVHRSKAAFRRATLIASTIFFSHDLRFPLLLVVASYGKTPMAKFAFLKPA
jgi:hypothetical protein